ncbi:MAG: hypothetical protein FH751_14160 [Firmicutes bacterium]|nr:hypothetical protein [Bacillota bacterium]
MKKLTLTILSIIIILILWRYSYMQPTLKGFYQSEVNGYHIQMLIREDDNTFIEWIDNREVDRGTYEKFENNSYRIKSNKQSFEIILNDNNSFEMIINKLNEGKPINMKNISTDDYMISFGKWDDVDEYIYLLD